MSFGKLTWALATIGAVIVFVFMGCGAGEIDDDASAPRQATAKPPAAPTLPPVTPTLPPPTPTRPPSPPAATTPAKSGPLATGTSSSAGSFAASPEGTRHSVGAEGKALEGMVIQVDPKAHRQSTRYLISYAPITACNIKNIRPVSPLISIDSGGGYAERGVDVTVPVELESDDFPLAFFYQADTGKLEGLPLLKYDSSSATFVSCHFLPFFISATKTKDLDAAIAGGSLDSGFRPGRDDWRFANYGSYAEPGGTCAGMTASALWYYVNRPDGPRANLTMRIGRDADRRPWQEDAQGYRLASAVQHDLNWDSRQTEIQQELSGTDDRLTMRSFAYAMMVTPEPLEVGVFRTGGGHSLIGYRIENNALYVADPNYHGDGQRLIRFDPAAGTFEPYQSGQNSEEIAKGNSKAYNQIEFTGRTAFVDWNRIAARWQELKAGRAGNDLFPSYKLFALDDSGREVKLDSAMALRQASVRIMARLADGPEGKVEVFRDGRLVEPSGDGIDLEPGGNDLGLVVNGKVKDSWEYIDYARVTITREE